MFFTVTIDDHGKHFSPGQNITGNVYCSIENPFYTEVKVRLIGEECSYGIGSPKSPISGDRCWKMKFLKTQSVTIRSGCFDIGTYRLPFNLGLPRYMPSSYLGKHGYVKFFVRATLTVHRKEEKEDEVEFKVFSPIDLNDMVNLWLTTSTHSDGLVVKKWWCIREAIRMNVKLQRNAFVLGEVITVAVELTNDSCLSVSVVKFELYVRIAAKVASPKPSLSVHQLLASNQGSGVPRYKTLIYLSRLKIPETSQLPNFQKCTLFTQKAILEVTAEFKDSSKTKLKVEVELVLGHIPIDGHRTISRNVEGDRNVPESSSARASTYGVANSRPSSPLPPHPTDSPSRLVVPEIRTHPSSPSTSIAPIPMGLFETTKSVPYPPVSPFTLPDNAYPPERQNLPYPPNDGLRVYPPYPTPVSCPYPVETGRSHPTPYSKITSRSTEMLHPPCLNRNSWPYTMERSDVRLRPRSIHAPFSESELPRAMPMPAPSIASFERDIPYPVRTPPYPTGDRSGSEMCPSASGNVAGYPSGRSPPHPSLRFAEITPMPMPTKRSPIACGSIGFAVPTSQSSEAPQVKDRTETEVQPSAPLLDEIKTPPIADIEELEDPFLADASSVRPVEAELDAGPSDGGSLRLPTPPAADIEIAEETEDPAAVETGVYSDAPPTYEEICPLLKKNKKERLKREKAVAM